MTIRIHCPQSAYRTFKAYDTAYVLGHRRSEFPDRVSHHRFVEWTPTVILPLWAYLPQGHGQSRGIAFVDATTLKVCHHQRMPRHKVFAGIAARGTTSMGWVYGFTLHLIVHDRGAILACRLTPGHGDDRQPWPDMARTLGGQLLGDQGYLAPAQQQAAAAAGGPTVAAETLDDRDHP